MLRKVVFGWFALGLVAAMVLPLGKAPYLIPLIALGTVGAWFVAYTRSRILREALQRLDVRAVLLAQAIRLPIGIAFLVEQARGNLPALFAERAGYGDILAGTLALLLAAMMSSARVTSRARALLLAWNTIGFADIVMVLATAQYLLLLRHDALLPRTLGRLPYSLLPTFFVPLVVATHVLIYGRARRSASGARDGESGRLHRRSAPGAAPSHEHAA